MDPDDFYARSELAMLVPHPLVIAMRVLTV